MVLRPAKPGGFGTNGSAARWLAVDSIKNIANVQSGTGSDLSSASASDPEVMDIRDILSASAAPLSVADVADRLQWDSAKTADALARGGRMGLLTFTKNGDTTSVALAPY